MRIYKLYGTATSTTANLANITFAKNGKIAGIKWAASLDSVTDNFAAQVELSFQAVSFIANNDTAGPIDQISIGGNFVTSGLAQGGINQQTTGLEIPVALGEKMYLNLAVTGTGQIDVTCFIYVDE